MPKNCRRAKVQQVKLAAKKSAEQKNRPIIDAQKLSASQCPTSEIGLENVRLVKSQPNMNAQKLSASQCPTSEIG
jgi:hypothetical protein